MTTTEKTTTERGQAAAALSPAELDLLWQEAKEAAARARR